MKRDSIGAVDSKGWLSHARRQPSPNFDARPAGSRPELIVVHAISLPPGRFGGPHIDALFCNALDPDDHPFFREIVDLRVSAHLLIRRDGETVQYVSFDERAWHAGVSAYRGRSRCNDFSIGIELEGTDEHPYTERQYNELVRCIRAIRRAYPHIDDHALAGHSEIAPGRKTDPGPHFDWSKLCRALGVDPSRRGPLLDEVAAR